MTDAITYLHGSGASVSGPITTTAKSFTGSIAITGVLTITAGTAGSQLLVGDILTGANILINPCVVTSITTVTAANGVGTYVVSAPQVAASATILASPLLQGDLIVVGAVSQESNLELDFGAPNSGGSYPWLPAFPSLTEKGYSFPPEVVGYGGVELGLHIIITGPLYGNALTSVRFDVQTAATTNATNIIASRTLTLAQMQVTGAHYFIPVNFAAVLEFLRFNMTNAPANNGFVGSIVAWFGPKTGGEQ